MATNRTSVRSSIVLSLQKLSYPKRCAIIYPEAEQWTYIRFLCCCKLVSFFSIAKNELANAKCRGIFKRKSESANYVLFAFPFEFDFELDALLVKLLISRIQWTQWDQLNVCLPACFWLFSCLGENVSNSPQKLLI